MEPASLRYIPLEFRVVIEGGENHPGGLRAHSKMHQPDAQRELQREQMAEDRWHELWQEAREYEAEGGPERPMF